MRLKIVKRLRKDAGLYHPVVAKSEAKGCSQLNCPVAWWRSRPWAYGRMRQFRYKHPRCRWAVSGPHLLVHALVVHMAG